MANEPNKQTAPTPPATTSAPAGASAPKAAKQSKFVVLHEGITDHQHMTWRRGRVIEMPPDHPVTLRLLSLEAIRKATPEEATHEQVALVADADPSAQEEIARLKAELQAANQRNAEITTQLQRELGRNNQQ